MKKVFVSGCYDILHAGHVQFFEDARALGGHLTVCFASHDVLQLTKGRMPALPDDNKKKLIGSLRCVDVVVSSSDLDTVFDFKTHIEKMRPDILAVTEDDKHKSEKSEFCKKYGIKFVVIPKRNFLTQVSTTKIRERIKKA